MGTADGAKAFLASGDGYDRFMGRYSRPLAAKFADFAGVAAGQRALDIGCGPGALTAELVARLGAASVAAVDPSPPFVADCGARNPGVEVQVGRSEELPFPDETFDVALAQLVFAFVSDHQTATAEMRRVVRPGGVVATCIWDLANRMQMLRLFWDSALALDAGAPDEARTLPFGGPSELVDLFVGAGLRDVTERTVQVESAYADVDELWGGFMMGIGPAGTYLRDLPVERHPLLRAEIHRRLGKPSGGFTLTATATCVAGLR